MLAASAALAVSPPSFAAPSTTALVVPFPPGGSTDALARQLQPGLQAALGRNVIVENKSGAAGSVGAAYVAKSPPDGSSFLVTFDSHAVIPAILEQPPLNVETDLVPVFLVGTAPYVIAANADKPYRNFADVVAACKEKAGAVRYASVGIGTLGHLAMTVLGKKAGVEITHVPYRGGGPAMNDVLGGHVDLIAGSAALITPQLSSGRIRPIMQLGRERLSNLRDTPTAIESGFPDYVVTTWWGFVAPGRTPAEVVAKISSDTGRVLKMPDISAKLVAQGLYAAPSTPSQFEAHIHAETARYAKIVKEAGIKAE